MTMTPEACLELVGYFASALVVVSLLMTSVVKLRIINSIGSFIFAIYALCIHSYPTAVMNFCLVGINLYFLIKLFRKKTTFSVQSCMPWEGAVRHFLSFYEADIHSLFPLLELGSLSHGVCFLVYADAAPVGILVGEEKADGVLSVELDYSAPSHRDCSVGRHLYAHLPALGIHELHAKAGGERHDHYLESMGFVRRNCEYVLKLS